MAGLNPAPQNALGIVFMASGFFLFGVVDTGGKFLTASFHPVQIVWVRQLGFLAAVVVLLAVRGGAVLATKRPGLQLLRGALAVSSATLFIVAVTYVPLADAVAVSFVAPFFVTLMGVFILKERIGLRRLTAVGVGFLGAMIVIRPGLGVLHPAAFLILLAALFFAMRQILSRVLARHDSTETTIAWSALTGSAIMSLPLFWVWQWPTGGVDWAVMAGVAVLAGLAEFLIIRALELAEAVAVAPVHYSMMVWGTFWGWLVFNELPDFWTWLGAGITIASGAYTFHRERRGVAGKA